MTTKSLGGSPRGGEGEPASTSSSRGAWDVQGSPRPGSPYRTAAEWGDPPRPGYGLRYYLFILVLFTVLVLVGTVGAR